MYSLSHIPKPCALFSFMKVPLHLYKASSVLLPPESIVKKALFSKTLHLMLAVVTRYAVGLIYDTGIDPEEELLFEKELLLRAYRA